VAFLAAAPEVAESAGAARAGGAGARRASKGAAAKRGKAGGSRVKQQVEKASSPITDDMSAEQVTEELQHRRRVAAAVKADDHADDVASTSVTKPDTASSSKAAPLFVVGKAAPVQTGGGAVLGVMAWVVFRNYLEGGVPQVKRLLAAKFLNKTGA
jgi:hypothetical protein